MFAQKSAMLASAVALIASTAGADTLTGTTSRQVTIVDVPGGSTAVVSDIPASSALTIQGCTADGEWCKVEGEGATGWVRADALDVTAEGQTYVLTQRPASVKVETIKGDKDAAAGTGMVAGAAAGAIIGGPPGAAVGAVVGALGGAAAGEPDKKVVTYTVQNPVPSVVYDGDLAVGSVLPNTVQLTPVPGSDYAYVYVQNRPVLVDPTTHKVITVVR